MGEQHRNRNKNIRIWLLEEEHALLSKKADIANMSMSEFIRRMILSGETRGETNFTREESQKFIYELNRIGNNINQIAYRVNAKAAVDSNDFNNLRDEFVRYLGLFQDVAMDRSIIPAVNGEASCDN